MNLKVSTLLWLNDTSYLPKIGPWLLLMTHRKWHKPFYMTQKPLGRLLTPAYSRPSQATAGLFVKKYDGVNFVQRGSKKIITNSNK